MMISKEKKELISKIANEALLRITKERKLLIPETYRFYFKICAKENGVSNYEDLIKKSKLDNQDSSLNKSANHITKAAKDILDAVDEHNKKLSASEEQLDLIVNLEDSDKTNKKTISQIEAIKSANKLLKKHIESAKQIVKHEMNIIEKIEGLALQDYLTTIGNRQLFDIDLRSELNRVWRYGRVASILMFDLDDFKYVNDTYGHVVGDRVLQAIASYLKNNLRVSDGVYRYGGDEFIILLPETNEDQASEVGKKILEDINSVKYRYKDKLFNVSASCGITAIKSKDNAETVLERLDRALYEVKHNRKGEFYCII